MQLPILQAGDVELIVPNCRVSGSPIKGGQKIVFPCEINGKMFAIKFMATSAYNVSCGEVDDGELSVEDEVLSRAHREVSIMSRCSCPYLIKLGPVLLSQIEYNGQHLLFFSEEWVDGNNLKNCRLDMNEVKNLGLQISCAIEELWSLQKVHRDIKPGNIIYNRKNNTFILLDMGFAFDVDDKSLTKFGYIPGTVQYLSPDQLNYSKKRELDFRSDLFSLGVVMYETFTGVHPFYRRGMTEEEVIRNILLLNPPPPSAVDSSLSKNLDGIIMRLLSKQPNQRFRSCLRFRQLLEAC